MFDEASKYSFLLVLHILFIFLNDKCDISKIFFKNNTAI